MRNWQNANPSGESGFYTYAAIQAFADAAAKAGSTNAEEVAKALRDGTYDTVLGPISFDAKGDPTKLGFVWYVWRNGAFAPKE